MLEIFTTVALTAIVTWVVQAALNAIRHGTKKAIKAKEERDKEVLRELIETAIDPIKHGTQAGLRHTLHVLGDAWIKRGYATFDEKEDYANMYRSYHDLGKNGVMDRMFEDIMSLPTVKPTINSETSN